MAREPRQPNGGFPLALRCQDVYTPELGQSSVVACGPQRARRLNHGD